MYWDPIGSNKNHPVQQYISIHLLVTSWHILSMNRASPPVQCQPNLFVPAQPLSGKLICFVKAGQNMGSFQCWSWWRLYFKRLENAMINWNMLDNDGRCCCLITKFTDTHDNHTINYTICFSLISHIYEGVIVAILFQNISEERAGCWQDTFMCCQRMLIFQYQGNITKAASTSKIAQNMGDKNSEYGRFTPWYKWDIYAHHMIYLLISRYKLYNF